MVATANQRFFPFEVNRSPGDSGASVRAARIADLRFGKMDRLDFLGEGWCSPAASTSTAAPFWRLVKQPTLDWGIEAMNRWTNVVWMTGVLAGGAVSMADAFGAYALSGAFSLPSGASSYDVLSDGRVISMVGADVFVESGVGLGSFAHWGTLPNADIGSGAFATAFVKTSPDGTRIAVGNNGGASFGNFQIGVFDFVSLSGDWFDASHFQAEWVDDDNFAFTDLGVVSVLDTTSDPNNPATTVVVDGVGGFSGGVAFDGSGRLYTGNGFATSGPSGTGAIKAFDVSSRLAGGGGPLDFESDGTLVADVLSALSLGFDLEGNLHVGGGDLFGGSGDNNYAGLIRGSAVQDALDGLGPIDSSDANQLRRFDPNAGPESNYDVNFNPVTGSLLLRDGETVYAFTIPEPGTLSLSAVFAVFVLMTGGRVRRADG